MPQPFRAPSSVQFCMTFDREGSEIDMLSVMLSLIGGAWVIGTNLLSLSDRVSYRYFVAPTCAAVSATLMLFFVCAAATAKDDVTMIVHSACVLLWVITLSLNLFALARRLG